jgi:hypothetical protein
MKHVPVLVLLGVLAVAPVSAFADWDHEVKHNQLTPYAESAFSLQPSYISDTMQIVADDFTCSGTGYITDVEFYALCKDIGNLNQIRITFWDGVPAGAAPAHPGALKDDIYVGPADADGIGWQYIGSDSNVPRLFKVNLPQDDWFAQDQGNTYWIGIQGVLAGTSRLSWSPYDALTDDDTFGDDAVLAENVMVPTASQWGELVWAHGALGDIVMEADKMTEFDTFLQSADMSFKLTGTFIPEPATLGLVALGALCLGLFRSRRK